MANNNETEKKQIEVILTHHIVNLDAAEGDTVKVSPGYARNFLLPQGLAIPNTAANQRRVETSRTKKAEREAAELQHMTELRDSLKSLQLTISMRTGEGGKLFGSVTSGTICDELKNQFDVALERKKVNLPKPIKALGEHDVPLKLHADIEASLKVIVESENPIEVVEEKAETAETAPTEA